MSYNLLFEKANELYSAGAYNQAEDLYRQILEAVPENPDVLCMMGLTAHAKGCFDEACEYFYKALQYTPRHVPLYFNLAVSLTAAGKPHEAINAYFEVIKLNPHIKEAYNNLGGIYESLNQPEAAEEYYRKALASDASYLEPAVNLAVLENDVITLQNLADENPTSALPLYYLSLLNFKQNNFTKADEYIKSAQNFDNASADIYLLAGNIALKLNNFDEASKAFTNALQINAKCVPALINLALLTQDESLYRKALDLAPDNADAHAGLAALLYRQKRTLEALEEYRRTVIINPDIPEVSNNLAMILKDIGEYERAADLLLNAIKQAPQYVEFSVNLAETLTLFYYQQPENAKKIAKQWQKFMPDNLFANRVVAAFNGSKSVNSKPYSEALFDVFAENYEQIMQNINYSAINKLKEIGFAPIGKILDLGCGTGLVGQAFKSAENKFTGVDISQKMLDMAALKNAYTDLIKDDIVHFLHTSNLKFNFIIALDVVEYVDDFTDMIMQMKHIPFVFTIENASEKVTDFQLDASGRYRHNPQYIRNQLADAGYKNITSYPLILRQENGTDVNGTLFWAE